jgi:WD40 repeat protein
MFVWQAHEGAVASLAFVPNGGGLLSTGMDGVLKLWDPLTGSLVYHWKLAEAIGRYSGGESDLLRVVTEPTGRFATVALRSRGVQSFDLQNYKVADELRLTNVLGLAPAPAGKGFFVVGYLWETVPRGRPAGNVHQYDYEEGRVIATSRDSVESGALAIHPNGAEIIAGPWRLSWPKGIHAEHSIDGSSIQYAVSGDGDKLFGIHGSRLIVWGFQLGFERRRLKGHIAAITALTTTPDGRTLWTASADASVRQWDIDTYKCEKWYGLKIGPLGCVAVSPDGLIGAAGSSHNGSIALWDLG